MTTEEEDWRLHWRAMEDACRRIMSYVRGYDSDRFAGDDRTIDAVLRNLQLIVRSAEGIDEDARVQLDRDHWRTIARLSEAVANSVDRDNSEDLWWLATEQVPELLEALEEVALDRDRAAAAVEGAHRGRLARHPLQIPLPGWRDIVLRIWNRIFEHNVFIVSAGVAFYGLLSLFPAIATLVSVYGLLFDATDVRDQLEALAKLFPGQAWHVIQDQLTRVVQNPSTALSVSAIVGFLFTLWSSRAGVGALMVAMNIVYEEPEKRSLVGWYALSLLLTVGAIVFCVVALATIVGLPVVFRAIGLEASVTVWMSYLRWPILALVTVAGLAIIYRYGPSRRLARWRWISGGAVAATVLWLLGSVAFSAYVSVAGNFNRTYGSLGAVVLLMLWFYVGAFVILLGAELDAETEHQVRLDSTVGHPRPMGERGAHMADTLGKRP